ncbi:MAG: FeoB-associated Cys-rich membrane protein [Acidobacteria bacterium]|nr:FeoB-associated Cys-rich membrane protein [Acidobacteriota bacterium]
MFDWQTIVVGLIILAALFYVGRRGLTRLRSFRASKAGAASCETGCGKCETSPAVAAPLKTFVQIERASQSKRSHAQN